ncbi:MAG: glycoside hydrolase [Desulfuromonas sp.]|nr:MAG: glycoside hydrolase [Desulfuromonas sp.]
MDDSVQIVLCWHMHQPYYRDGLDETYHLPWVYLHAIKDYVDMVAHLEAYPEARVVVNFAPVLLEQLDDYARQMRGWLQGGERMCDPLLNLVAGETPIPAETAARAEILAACRRAHAPTMIDRHAPFRALQRIAADQYADGQLDSVRIRYLTPQFFTDLLMWYHLAWIGSSVRRTDPRVTQLMARKNNFTQADQTQLIALMADIIEGIVPRYRALMESGQIELSMSPYGHPIVPLLIDFKAAYDALPEAALPQSKGYPGGPERAVWHLQKGVEVFNSHFGSVPRGVWLSEGGVSSAALELLDNFGFAWTASGEGVWRASCEASEIPAEEMEHKKKLYHPLVTPPHRARMFFRDDGLSDLIGFHYKDWHAEDAAADFCTHLENIAEFLSDVQGPKVVTVILDGENAWEYYPDNGYHFLRALYRRLTEHPRLRMATCSEVLTQPPVEAERAALPVLKAGSWVYGSFSTWIGDKDKNAAWDLLVEAKECYDRVVASGMLSDEKLLEAEAQLAVCEGSDWFWWFGDYNPSDSVRDFDQLFRRHLIRLYQLLEKVPPQKLKNPLSHGGGEMENAGTMRRN